MEGKIFLQRIPMLTQIQELLLNENLPIKKVTELSNFATLEKKELILELVKYPKYKEILFKYIFLRGADSHVKTEITYDKLNVRHTFQRYLSHSVTGGFMLIMGISLIFTKFLIEAIMGFFFIVDIALVILYLTCVAFDFWDVYSIEIEIN